MDLHSIKDLLQQFPIFKTLSDYEMEPIVELANENIYSQDSHIFLQGYPITKVYFIYKGEVKVYKTDQEGREQIVNVLKSGDMFPHQGFFRQDSYPAHAVALKESTVISIEIEYFENILITHPEISIKLFRVMGDVIVDLQNRLHEKISHSTFDQIVMLLLRLSHSHGIEENNGFIRISAKFTNKELANMIGSSRETVNRTLTKLKKEKLIFINENGYLILNSKALDEAVFLNLE